MIPKIIHQTGPTDLTKWHPLWFKCQESWKKNFLDFEYRFWNDEEIDELIEEHFPQYWKMYNEFPIHILKIDFVRLCFMYQYGGIYADLDYYCYSNFYDELKNEVYLVENPFGNDPIENSLMCSVPKHDFWIECMELTKERYEYVKRKFPERIDNLKIISCDEHHGLKLRPQIVFLLTGTNHLSSAFRMTRQKVSTLPGKWFNNNDISYHTSYVTKHVHTGLWGEESIQLFHSKEDYQKVLRNIPIEEFDFYTDYSNGKFLMEDYHGFDKNDSDERIKLETKYSYT
jgi:hypothetical protein